MLARKEQAEFSLFYRLCGFSALRAMFSAIRSRMGSPALCLWRMSRSMERILRRVTFSLFLGVSEGSTIFFMGGWEKDGGGKLF